jgi:hypothetical protein
MGARRRNAASGLVVSLVAHLLVLTALVAGLRTYQPRAATPPIELRILPPWPVQRPPAKPVAAKRAASARDSAPAAPPSVSAVAAEPAARPVETPAPSIADAEQLRGVLRGLLGCDRPALLKEEERRACDQRAARPAMALSTVNPDNLARYVAAQNREPFLAKKPHNGCVLRVGDQDQGATSQGGSIAAGIACAWSFW